jgi:hypothetical protein
MYEYLGGLPRVLNFNLNVCFPSSSSGFTTSTIQPGRFLNQAATWAMTNASNVWFTVLPNRAKSLLFASKKA